MTTPNISRTEEDQAIEHLDQEFEAISPQTEAGIMKRWPDMPFPGRVWLRSWLNAAVDRDELTTTWNATAKRRSWMRKK